MSKSSRPRSRESADFRENSLTCLEMEVSSFFKGCEAEFIRQVIEHSTLEMFAPGQYLMKEGEEGHAMYFIRRGSVEVLVGPNEEKVAILAEGDIVGEMGLLHEPQRAASVKAIEVCDCRSLHEASFQRLVRQFPGTKIHLESLAKQRLEENRKCKTKSLHGRRHSHGDSLLAPRTAKTEDRRASVPLVLPYLPLPKTCIADKLRTFNNQKRAELGKLVSLVPRHDSAADVQKT